MTLVERFLKYVSFDTQSNEESGATPSTPGQMVFAEYLKEELETLGLEEVSLDDNGYLYATLPANVEGDAPVVGFIAHMDTSPDMSGKDVKPRIVPAYDGGDITLCAEEGIVLSPAQFPELLEHRGEDLIVTDGHTLLGADDKAGIAEIVSAIVYLQQHPEVKHGKIRIGFNPDEEIGLGAHKFDVEKFGCDWAYTMDGGEVGELEFENFNAASAKLVFKGRNVHPGYAKGKMINSLRVANRFMSLLPDSETPEHTEGYEGFYHLVGVNGEVEQTTVSYSRPGVERPILQHAPPDRAGDARHRHCFPGHERSRCGTLRAGDTRWYGWRATFVQRVALPQHLCRRAELPRPLRVRTHSQHGEGDERHRQDCGTGGCSY